MGNDPKLSVVDKWCRVHEVPNLFIIDASVFVTSGGLNPALTIHANAFRVCDYLVAEATRGNIAEKLRKTSSLRLNSRTFI